MLNEINKSLPEDKKLDNIRIPRNLYILATMNTSDQNVFVLDTAFQRRWAMKHIPNKFEEGSAKWTLPDSDKNIKWKDFAEKANEIILNNRDDLGISGDKRLGAWFVSEDDCKDKTLFGEKVLKFLWDDAFKMDRGKFFKEGFKAFDVMLEEYEKDGNALMDVLKEDVYKTIPKSEQGAGEETPGTDTDAPSETGSTEE